MRSSVKVLIFMVLLMALPVSSYIWLFQPMQEEIDSKAEETRQKQSQLNDLDIALARDDTVLQEDIKNLREVIKLLEAKLPEKKEVDGILRDITQIAEKYDLNSKRVIPDKVIQGPNYCELPIKLSFIGMFSPSFFNFLRDVEQLPRLTRISSMKIVADNEVSGRVSADVTVTIYYESDRKVAVAQ